MLNVYEIKVKLTGGKTHNCFNANGTECKVGDVITLRPRSKSRENAEKAAKQILKLAGCKGVII